MGLYIRNRIGGGTYFFTVVIADRRQTLLTDHAAALRCAFREARHRHPFVMDAICVLPDHLHCIWTMPPGDSDYPMRWRLIKSRFSRAVPLGEAVSASRRKAGERGLWQRRYWEHTIRNESDFERHVDYIHYNPVKHRHAAAPAAWPLSSFHKYVAAGIYQREWAASGEVLGWDLD